MIMHIAELDQSIGNFHDLFLFDWRGRVPIRLSVGMLVLKPLNLGFDAFVLKFGIAVLTLCDDAFNIAVLLLGDQLKTVDANLVLFASVILKHG